MVDGIRATPLLAPAQWKLVGHLIREAGRLGLTLVPHICSTWGPAGSPEMTTELSQQILVWSETEVEGGRPFTGDLPDFSRHPPGKPNAFVELILVDSQGPGPGLTCGQAGRVRMCAEGVVMLIENGHGREGFHDRRRRLLMFGAEAGGVLYKHSGRRRHIRKIVYWRKRVSGSKQAGVKHAIR